MNLFVLNEEKRLITVNGDPAEIFEEKPLAMLGAVKLSAETGFDFHKGIYKAILEKTNLLEEEEIDHIRGIFEEILVADYAGKGLKMLDGTGLLSHLIGDHYDRMTTKEANAYETLVENIDRTRKVLSRRLGLFYLCFEGNAAADAVDMLNYDVRTRQLLRNAIMLINHLDYQTNAFEIKQFIKQYGFEIYEYVQSLSKTRSVVYGSDTKKIRERDAIMEGILRRGDPIFVADMKITKEDLIKHGLAEPEKADEMLLMILDAVHKDPSKNSTKALLKQAEDYKLNPFAAKFRRIQWTK